STSQMRVQIERIKNPRQFQMSAALNIKTGKCRGPLIVATMSAATPFHPDKLSDTEAVLPLLRHCIHYTYLF
ncbi:hypothetical protein OM195_23760, partial [Escherichia albertii]|nr:hypothetical protein [Escherichia albertii]